MDMSDGDRLSVGTLMRNTATELDRLAEIAQGMDVLVADLVAQLPSSAQGAKLQDIDYLRQALQAIATVSRNASEDLGLEHSTCVSRARLAREVTLASVLDACLTEASVNDSHSERSSSDAPVDTAILF